MKGSLRSRSVHQNDVDTPLMTSTRYHCSGAGPQDEISRTQCTLQGALASPAKRLTAIGTSSARESIHLRSII